MNIDQLDRTQWRKLFQSSCKYVVKLLPYAIAAFVAMVVVQVRWYTVDSDSYFIPGATAQRAYYAVRDMNYDDNEATEKLRAEVADGIIGVVVKGHMKSEVGFDDECEILLNRPLDDRILPKELRELLDAAPLDTREQIVATVRSIHDDLQRNVNLSADEKDEFIWQRIGLIETNPSSANIIYQILVGLSEGDQKVDPDLTERIKSLAASDIEQTKHIFYAGDRIVNKGEIVTPQLARILKLQGYPEGRFPMTSLVFAVIVACISVLWISKTMPHVFISTTYHGDWTYSFFLLLLGWLFQIGVIYWGVNGVGIFPVIAMIYLTLPDIGALNCAVAVTLSASIITSGYDVTAFAINAISGCAGAILGISLFKRNYSRSAVWIHVFVLGIAMLGIASVLQWGLTNLMSVRQVAIMFTACLLLSFMVIVLLPLLEILFDIVSPLQLVELTQPSHPLLKRMQVEAPGTYHHSQMVGNLAEAAAEKIGLNPMLLRAGACFHDIGKLKRPQSFIENQISGINAHDEMSPALSALVILSHVKDGLELADEYRLPSQIKAFIAEHHGTTCLTYFYRKALQAGLKADESQFCYPGPRPQSKETGVLMIADSTEAAARAESANIKGILDLTRLADTVVQSKISTGQLDEVPFTLKDLSDIKAALVNTLRSMYHTRDIKPLKSLPEEQGKETHDAHGSSNIVAVQAEAEAAEES